MDIIGRWFIVTAVTSVVILIGLTGLRAVTPANSVPTRVCTLSPFSIQIPHLTWRGRILTRGADNEHRVRRAPTCGRIGRLSARTLSTQ